MEFIIFVFYLAVCAYTMKMSYAIGVRHAFHIHTFLWDMLFFSLWTLFGGYLAHVQYGEDEKNVEDDNDDDDDDEEDEDIDEVDTEMSVAEIIKKGLASMQKAEDTFKLLNAKVAPRHVESKMGESLELVVRGALFTYCHIYGGESNGY